MRFVAVFDTNVLLSGIGWNGNPFQCLELARTGRIKAVTCQEILDELTEKLERRLRLTSEVITETLADLLTALVVVPIPGELREIMADPDDDKVLECALVANATHVVSGDRKHLLSLRTFRSIPIVSPAEFLRLVSASESESQPHRGGFQSTEEPPRSES